MLKSTTMVIMLVAVSMYGQAPDTLWTKHYGGAGDDRGFCIQQTLDGGYIVSGKYNVALTGDDMYLLKLDATGNQTWEMFFGGSGTEFGYSVQQTTDSGYVVAGYTNSMGAGGYDYYLVKTNSNGNPQGARTYGASQNDYAYSIQQTTNNGYVLVGLSYSYGLGGDVYLVKTNTNGTVAWDTNYGGADLDVGYCVQQTDDGGYVIVGSTYSATTYDDVYLVKTDASGAVEWDTTYGGASGDYGYAVRQTSDHGYIIAGSTYSFGPNNIYAIKTDSLGNVQWDSYYGTGNNFDKGHSVEQTADGGYVFAGYSWDGVSALFDLYIVKTNSLGTVEWTKNIPAFGGFSGEEYRYSIKQTSDLGYTIAGWTNNIFSTDDDVFIVRLAPPGPDIEVSPDTLLFVVNDTTGPGPDDTDTMEVSNIGNAELVVDSIKAIQPWITSVSPSSFTVSPGNEQDVLVSVDAAGLNNGTYPTAVLIYSNDPVTPVYAELAILTVNITGILENETNRVTDQVMLYAVPPKHAGSSVPIRFVIPEQSSIALKIYDISGKLVNTLCQGIYEQGEYNLMWNSSQISAGVYFINLEVNGQNLGRKVILF